MAGELIGLGIFKSLLDTAKGLKDMNDAAVRNAAVIELQEKILAAQAQQTELFERISELEKEVARLETWENEKERYTLADIGNGVLAYVLKPEAQGSEPPHHLCANCYANNHKSILQPETLIPGRHHVEVCHSCSAIYWPHGGVRDAGTLPKVNLGYPQSKRRR